MVKATCNKWLALDVIFAANFDTKGESPSVKELCIMIYTEHFPNPNVIGFVPGNVDYYVNFEDLVMEYLEGTELIDDERERTADILENLAKRVRSRTATNPNGDR